MRNRIVHISLFAIYLLLITLTSCSGTEEYEEKINAKNTIDLLLSTRTSSNTESEVSNESTIRTLRVIVYPIVSEINNQITYGNQVLNQLINLPSSKQFKLTIEKGNPVRVLVIANEDNSWSLDNTQLTAEQLKQTTIQYKNGLISSPFTMFCESRTFSATKDENEVLKMVRNIARVDVTLKCDDTTPFHGGTLTLTNAHIERMASISGLGEEITNLTSLIDENQYLASSTINFQYTPQSDGTFTTNTLTFYVPEHIVNDTQLYTYLAVSGVYQPANGNPVPVAYQIPIGYEITTDKLENNNFTKEDLIINRNHHYIMNGRIKNLQQIKEITVEVADWRNEDVNGSIGETTYKLNVLELKTDLEIGSETLVQFWSNLPQNQISVLAQCTDENGNIFSTNDIFTSLSGKNAQNLEFIGKEEQGENWGHLRLRFKDENIKTGKIYTITLTAGVLQRTIQVTVKSPFQEEEQ